MYLEKLGKCYLDKEMVNKLFCLQNYERTRFILQLLYSNVLLIAVRINVYKRSFQLRQHKLLCFLLRNL